MGRTAKKWGENGEKWARNGLKRVGQVDTEIARSRYNQLNAAGHWTSSWGGAVVRDDNGTYHMWVNELTDSCGMYYW